jgi:hypothetical protein
MSETDEPLPNRGDFDRLLERTFPDRIGDIRRTTQSGESPQEDCAYWGLLAFIQWEKDSRERTPGAIDRPTTLLRYGTTPATVGLLAELLHERATLHELTGLSPDQGDARIRLVELLDAEERRIRRELAPSVTQQPIVPPVVVPGVVDAPPIATPASSHARGMLDEPDSAWNATDRGSARAWTLSDVRPRGAIAELLRKFLLEQLAACKPHPTAVDFRLWLEGQKRQGSLPHGFDVRGQEVAHPLEDGSVETMSSRALAARIKRVTRRT